MPSKLDEMQARFRERLVLEKEERMIRIYNQNQQKVLERVKSNGSVLPFPQQGSKVKAAAPMPTRKPVSGVDRSRPLKPIQGKSQNRQHSLETPTNRNATSPTASQDQPDMATRTTTMTVRTSVSTSRSKVPPAPVRPPLSMKTVNPPASRNVLTATNGGLRPSSSTSTPNKPTVNGKPAQPKSAPAVRTAPPAKKAPVSSPPAARAPPTDPNLGQCDICGRSFDKERLPKHLEICKKTSVKKRRAFDATKMRVKGTEAEQFVRRGAHKKEPATKGKKSDWRSQHETFISSIRQAKAVQQHLAKGGKLSDLPPPKPSENPDYVQCPHCQRKFNESAAERHIPKCRNILSNKKKVPAKK